ncbi:hypothetical protein MN116_002983 [Schistosoma mekongi]|uniref:Protein Abitram n=1 Tax=Schistosoma mekongi TaxID=38744 RepID=A0AAE1ZG58_SCHME|nr:hypothetical protein MN116_002983 [Schistosoma mekongi]
MIASMEYDDSKYVSCEWFSTKLPHSSASELPPNQFTTAQGFLIDNRTQRFVERYFNTFYLVDVGGEVENDICVLRHSNTLCVVGLAYGHHIFKRCNTNSYGDGSASKTHEILGLDYQVSSGLNRLKNKVKGRRKHGGHVLSKSTDILAYAVCDRGIRHPVVCGIPGNLLEVNGFLDITKNEPNPHCSENSSISKSKVRLTPLIDSGSTVNVGTYLSIILPKLRPKKHQGADISDTSNESILLTCSHNPCSLPLVGDISEQFDCLDQSDYATPIADFMAQTSLAKAQKVLNWDEYSAVRRCT